MATEFCQRNLANNSGSFTTTDWSRQITIGGTFGLIDFNLFNVIIEHI